MIFSKISQVAHYVPQQLVTNNDLASIMDTSHEWIFSRTGIAERHISRDEMTSDLAIQVADQLLTQTELKADLMLLILLLLQLSALMPLCHQQLRKFKQLLRLQVLLLLI